MRHISVVQASRPSIDPDHLIVDAGPRPLTELLAVASAAARSRTSVTFTGVKARSIEDLMRIAVTGGDCVTFGQEVSMPPLPARRRVRPRWSWLSRSGRPGD